MADLVPRDGDVPERRPWLRELREPRLRPPHDLVRAERGRDREQPDALARAVDPGEVVEPAAQELQATADAEDPSAGGCARPERVVQSSCAEPGTVGGDVLRPGEHDEVRVRQLCRRPHPDELGDLLERA